VQGSFTNRSRQIGIEPLLGGTQTWVKVKFLIKGATANPIQSEERRLRRFTETDYLGETNRSEVEREVDLDQTKKSLMPNFPSEAGQGHH
jgi:hypothetical protein